MIKILIKVEGNRIDEHCNIKNCTLGEVGLANYKLDIIKKRLSEIEFKHDLDVKETG